MVASPGGVGKSAIVIGMLMSLAFEKNLLGETIWDKDHKVLYINGEDPQDELNRRTAAFGMLHGISENDMMGRLFILGNDQWQVQKLNFLRADGRNTVIDEESFAFLETLVAADKFSVVVVDPLVNFVGVGNMNDNAAMAQVMRRFKQLAGKYNFAGCMVDHNKKGADAESQEAVSGAASKVNLSRRTLAVIRMTTAEGNQVNVLPSDCWRYVRVVATKTNMSPPSATPNTAWYELVSVPLGNGDATYPSGDNVHAVKRATLSAAANVQLTVDDKTIRRAICDVARRRKMIGGELHPYNRNPAGASNHRAIFDDAMDAVRQALPHNQWSPKDLKAIVTRHINQMLVSGWLVEEEIKEGRFRRGRGLRVEWSRTPWPNEQDNESAGAAHDQEALCGSMNKGAVNWSMTWPMIGQFPRQVVVVNCPPLGGIDRLPPSTPCKYLLGGARPCGARSEMHPDQAGFAYGGLA